MLHIGCHLSLPKALRPWGDGPRYQGRYLAFFTRNPRGSKAKAFDPKDADLSKGMGPLWGQFPCGPCTYTLNPRSTKEEVRQFARPKPLPMTFINWRPCREIIQHAPGNHLGQGAEIGIELIAACLNRVLYEKQQTTLLLETMAGKGTEVGRSFEEIRAILERIALQDKVGVCLDTCHIWDAGYDIVSDLDGVIREFDRVIGLSRLKAIHLNDSKNPLGAHKDRHEKIGEGMIGQVALSRVVRHPSLAGLPFILETPNELSGYAHEIDMMRQEAAK